MDRENRCSRSIEDPEGEPPPEPLNLLVAMRPSWVWGRGKENQRGAASAKKEGGAPRPEPRPSDRPRPLDPFDPSCPLADETRKAMLEAHNKWVKSMEGLDEETRRKMTERMSKTLPCWETATKPSPPPG